MANSLKSQKNIKRSSLDNLDDWKSEFIFLREEFDNIRHKQNPTPIGTTSEEVMHEHSC